MVEKWLNNLGSKTFIVVIIAIVMRCFSKIDNGTFWIILSTWIVKEGAVKFTGNSNG